MYTVCGHAHPHHTRPQSAVRRNTEASAPIPKRRRRRVSVG
jgi:hypothetical protein